MGRSREDRQLAASAAAVAGIVVVAFAAQIVAMVARDNGNDFTAYLMAARDLAVGHNPYAAQYLIPYRYPLFLAFILIPVVSIPVVFAAAAWYLAAIAALFVLCRTVLARVFPAADRVRQICIGGLAVLLFIEIIQNEMLNGQVDIFVTLACIAAVGPIRLARLAQGRLARLAPGTSTVRADVKAALCLGIAIAVKMLPVVLVPFFLVRRRYAAAAGAMAVAAVLCIAPAYLLGGPLAAYQPYWDLFMEPTLRRAPDSAAFLHRDVSVAGLVMTLGGWSATWLRMFISGAVVLLATVADAARDRESERADVIAASIYLVAMILVSPMSEIHYLVLALPAAIVVIGAALAARFADPQGPRRIQEDPRRMQWTAAIGLILIVAGEIARAQRSLLFCLGLLIIAAAASCLMARRSRVGAGLWAGASVM